MPIYLINFKDISIICKNVNIAKKNKIDVIKLQTCTADAMTINSNKKEFFIKDKRDLWNNESLYN